MTAWKKYLRIVVGIAILAFVVSRADFHALTIQWRPFLIAGLVLVVLCLFVAQGLSALRWKIILGPDSPPWRLLFRLYLIAAFFSLFLPTSIGGDAVRAVAANRAGSTGRVVGSVLLDRLFGVVALVVFAAIGLAIAPAPDLQVDRAALFRPKIVIGLLGAFLLLAALAWMLRRRLASLLAVGRQMRDVVIELWREPSRFGAALLVGFAVQGMYILAWLSLSELLKLPIPPSSQLVSVPIVSLSAMIPITLSGVGLREGAWTLLLRRFGISPADAVAYSLLYFACWMVVAGSGGILFAWKGTQGGVPASKAADGQRSEGVLL
jgi:uncharacterized membrane protein YbhN (UPF0104 family)